MIYNPRLIAIVLYMIFYLNISYAQPKDLNYYLPQIKYDSSIPTPEEFLGYQIGEWHISHDQLVSYCKELARLSDRIALKEIGRTHENRPLLNLIYTTPENHKNLEALRKQHLKLCDAEISKSLDLSKTPLVLYQGYSIHGNEASGSNAAMLNAYYLAAGESKAIKSLLEKSIVIIDPCYNPDGLNRFATWVNMHKNANVIGDENDREFSEEWPGGRTNHYWFDLNRDWLLLVHPESRARIKNFHHWKPNVLTDHHEMGKNSTFFFQPGVPSRTNPNTPQKNQDLTEDIAQYHMKYLDAIGSEYFMKKRYDDFYYGKGSTYPDANGAIGILFEQASTRGHKQETDNGMREFSFAIRNQVATSLSTQEACLNMMTVLKEYQRDFYLNVKKEAADNPTKGYIFYDDDKTKMSSFINKLGQHQILYQKTTADFAKEQITYPSGSYYIPLDQKDYKLVKTIFEKVSTFRDSIFYDVSAWTLPLAYDLSYSEITSSDQLKISTKKNQFLRTNLIDKTYQKLYAERSDTLVYSDDNNMVVKPKIAILVGDGISAYYTGAMWHTVDKRYGLPITKIDIHQFKNSKRLNKYNTLIMASGRYNELDSTSVAEMKDWIQNGGKLICEGTALRWAAKKGLVDLSFKKRMVKDPKTGKMKAMSTASSRNAQVIGGAIFATEMNLDHPLTEGYTDTFYPSFKKGTHFLEEPTKADIKVILRYTENPSLSGYVSNKNLDMIKGSPALVMQKQGKGKVICFVDNPVFRGYWYGGFRLFMNAIFL